MMNNKEYIREDLQTFKPYKVENITSGIKLDANENPYEMDKTIKEQIIKWLKEEEKFRIYPDSNADSLNSAIAKYYGVARENVTCGVGSDQLIDCMVRGVIAPGDSVVFPTPSFSMYKSVVALNHGKSVEVELNEDFSYNIEALIKACKETKAKLLILCTPNNPTGNILTLDEISYIAQNVSCPIIVDEAYGEFTKESAISLIKEFQNIVVFRTFSKAYGLAGLRVGYAIGSEKAIYPIEITKPPYNLNTFTQVVAEKVIENTQLYSKQIQNILEERDKLRMQLIELGIKVYPSEANFLLIEWDKTDLEVKLREKEIYIRTMSIRNKKMYRISVGTKKQNQILLDSIKEV